MGKLFTSALGIGLMTGIFIEADSRLDHITDRPAQQVECLPKGNLEELNRVQECLGPLAVETVTHPYTVARASQAAAVIGSLAFMKRGYTAIRAT